MPWVNPMWAESRSHLIQTIWAGNATWNGNTIMLSVRVCMSTQKKGVVNGNLRVHSASNLYVARSSVFPTVGHVNPTMNLLALTLRLADHLKAEVKR